MDAAAHQEVSERMRKYWASRQSGLMDGTRPALDLIIVIVDRGKLLLSMRMISVLSLACLQAFCGDVELLNHKNLDGWEVIGEGVWHILADGTLVGERDLRPVLRDAPFLHPGGIAYRDWLNV